LAQQKNISDRALGFVYEEGMSSAFGVTALSPRLDAAMALLELSAIFLVGWQGWSFISPHFLQTWCVLMTGLVMLRLVTSRLTRGFRWGLWLGGGNQEEAVVLCRHGTKPGLDGLGVFLHLWGAGSFGS
jgi:hypothetical protein